MLSLSSRSSSNMLKLLSNLLMVASNPASDCRPSACSARNWSTEGTKYTWRLPVKGFFNVRSARGELMIPLWSASSSLPRQHGLSGRGARPLPPAPERDALTSCSGWNAATVKKKNHLITCLIRCFGKGLGKGERITDPWTVDQFKTSGTCFNRR